MALSEDIIYKRLTQVKIAQESVETTSTWVLHHNKYVSSISRIWFDIFLTGELCYMRLQIHHFMVIIREISN